MWPCQWMISSRLFGLSSRRKKKIMPIQVLSDRLNFVFASVKLRKATVSFVISDRMERLDSHWTVLMKFDI